MKNLAKILKVDKQEIEVKGQATLRSQVQLSPQYQRSINLRLDFGNLLSLAGFICHQTADEIFSTIARQFSTTGQSAFTVTGPFGGGKSTLLNIFGSALGRNMLLRERAREKLSESAVQSIDSTFDVKKGGWTVIPMVGTREDIVPALHRAIAEQIGHGLCEESNRTIPVKSKGLNEILAWLEREADQCNGVLILVDEMGKFLEGAADGVGDLGHFQILAESIVRFKGKVLLIGALHQSIQDYGRTKLDEWRKVQGRFSDIPLVIKSDEVVELVGKAVFQNKPPEWIQTAAHTVSQFLFAQKPNLRQDYAQLLIKCSPFHPIMAALLGPVSRRQYGQNERSLFAFLSTHDLHGFCDFLDKEEFSSQNLYNPAHYLDYLRANLDPAISASSDGHHWITAIDAVDRAEAKVDAFTLSVVKNVAILDIFKKTSLLPATRELVQSIYRNNDVERVGEALKKLCDLRVLINRRHLGAYAVFEGSDFDIDAAMLEAKRKFQIPDLGLITNYLNARPIVGKRHYLKTGFLRWMSVRVAFLDDLRSHDGLNSEKMGAGEVLIVLPTNKYRTDQDKGNSFRTALKNNFNYPVLAFIPKRVEDINSLAIDLMALSEVQNHAQELHGDSVARREVSARISNVKQMLEVCLLYAFDQAQWFSNDDAVLENRSSSEAVSVLLENAYPATPHIVNELVNRDHLSSNVVKARKQLLYSMYEKSELFDLGFDGYPPERGIYASVLKITGLHKISENGETHAFSIDRGNCPAGLHDLWRCTDGILGDGKNTVSLAEIFDVWRAPPFGLKSGIMPILLMVYLKAESHRVSIYRDNVFCTALSEPYIDELLAKPKRFALRAVPSQTASNDLKHYYRALLPKLDNYTELNIARELVKIVLSLPKWTQRTDKISSLAKSVRNIIKNASDPLRLLYTDLPELIQQADIGLFSNSIEKIFSELTASYGGQLELVKSKLFTLIGVPQGHYEDIHRRSKNVQQTSGDFKLDSFILRLAEWHGDQASTEGILSILLGKPSREWTDNDFDRGMMLMAEWVGRFVQLEAYVGVRDRLPTREAVALVIGTGASAEVMRRDFFVSDTEVSELKGYASQLANQLADLLGSENINGERALAVVAYLGDALIKNMAGE